MREPSEEVEVIDEKVIAEGETDLSKHSGVGGQTSFVCFCFFQANSQNLAFGRNLNKNIIYLFD